MVGPYIPHVWKATNNENRVITIQFSREILNFEILNKRLFLPIKQLLLESIHGLHFFGQEAEHIKEEIVELTKIQGFHSATRFLNILHSLAHAPRRKLVSNRYESESLIHQSKSRRINKVCKYIEDSRHIWEGNLQEVRYTSVGSVIGTHAGPGAVAVAFFKM